MIITIAREHGTAGERISQLGAEKLGIPCYYKEMTALAAQESGLAGEFISGINSNKNAVMRELYLSTSAVQQAVIAQALPGEEGHGDVRRYRAGGQEEHCLV